MELISTFPALPLQYGCKIVLQALDPVTDAVVTGVKIVNPVCYGRDLTGGAPPAIPAAVAPLFVPLPSNAFDEEAATEATGDEAVTASS